MDFFETINTSKEVALMQANWYSALPDKRKSEMMCDRFEFGVGVIKHNAKKNNSYITDAEALLFYFEKNLKDEFSEETFEFIRQKMLERADKEWKERFNKMKKKTGLDL